MFQVATFHNDTSKYVYSFIINIFINFMPQGNVTLVSWIVFQTTVQWLSEGKEGGGDKEGKGGQLYGDRKGLDFGW